MVIDADGLLTSTEDVTTVTYVSASNPTPTGMTANVVFYYSPGTSIASSFQKGAIQVDNGSGGGGGCCWVK